MVVFGVNSLKSVGIVGGLGPQTTAKFYVDLVRGVKKKNFYSPKITIDNVAFPSGLEDEIIQKSKNEGLLLPCLQDSVERLNKSGVNLIAIPCNTAHLFIDELRAVSKARILSIIEETIKEIKKRHISKIGILATSKTLQSRLYQKELEKIGIQCIVPEKKSQEIVSKCILEILDEKNDKTTTEKLQLISGKLVKKGAESLLLACTDLRLAVEKKELPAPVIDSYEVLLNSAIKTIGGVKNGK